MACGDLLSGAAVSCTDPLQGGVGRNSNVILLNINDVESIAYDVNYQITAITRKATKLAYEFEGIKQSLKPSHEIVNFPSGLPGFRHQIQFSIFTYTQAQKNNIEQLARGRYLAIIQNPKKDVNAFEVYGVNVGLEATVVRRANQEEGGAYVITLSSPEGEPETKLPATITGLTFTAVETLVNALLV